MLSKIEFKCDFCKQNLAKGEEVWCMTHDSMGDPSWSNDPKLKLEGPHICRICISNLPVGRDSENTNIK